MERRGIESHLHVGYVDEAIAHHGVLDAGIAFVHKPFSSDTLVKKIQEVLGPSDERMSA